MQDRLKDEFPYWFIIKLVKPVDERRRYNIRREETGSEGLLLRVNPITWQSCYKENKKRIIEYFDKRKKLSEYSEDQLRKKEEQKEWAPAINSFRQVIMSSYSPITAWRFFEYNILEEMNHGTFKKAHDNYSIQALIKREETMKVNYRLASRRKGRSRIQNQSKYKYWCQVISHGKGDVKKRKNKKLTPEEEAWKLCFRANLYGLIWEKRDAWYTVFNDCRRRVRDIQKEKKQDIHDHNGDKQI